MGMYLVAGAEANTWNVCLAHPVGAIGRKIPFAGGWGSTGQQFERFLSSVHDLMIFGQGPRRKDFIEFEDEPGVTWLLVMKQFHFDIRAVFDKLLYLGQDTVRGFPEGHTAVNEDRRLVRDGVDGRCLDVHIRDRDLAMSEERIIA